jgi:hypothetical protein
MSWASSLFDEETVGVSASFRPARRKSVLVSQIVKKVQRVWYAKMVRVAVFRIRDVLIRILIRIQGYVPLNYGSGSLLFSQLISKCQPKIMFLSSFFLAYYLLEEQIRIIFGDWIRTRIKVSWSPGGAFIDQWSQIPITLMSTRIRIRNKVMRIKGDG